MNVPKLRFPGFEGEWETKKLGDLMEFKVTNSFSRENLNYEVGTVKNIHYGDIHTKFQTLFDITKEKVPYINEEISIDRISEDFYCKEGDIVFADASEDLNDVGKSIEIINLNNEKALSGLHTLLARPKESFFHLGFNGYLFKSNLVRTQIQKESQGSKVLSINVGRISNIKLYFPNLSEQRKIAELLSLIDERIHTQNKIIEQLETLIKGLSEKLFSQKIRFKGFIDEWERKKIGEICSFYKGSPLSKSDIITGGISKCIHYGELFTTYNAVISTVISHTNNDGFKSKVGDILMPSSDVTPLGLATASVILEVDVILGSDINVLRPKKNINPIFLSYLLNSEKKKIIELVSGTTVKHIYNKDLKQIEIRIPSIKEQTAIAQFLSSIDQKLQTEKDVLEQLEKQKKFLLQNLFV